MARPKKEIDVTENVVQEPTQEFMQEPIAAEKVTVPNPNPPLIPAPPRQQSTYVNPSAMVTPPPVKRAKIYEADTPIPCRSLTAGFLNMFGGKTKNTYQWLDAGTVEYVEYQDLQYALVGRSVHLNEPLIMVEDEELLRQPEWKRLQEIYDNIYSPQDLTEILKLPAAQMAGVIRKLPNGAKKSIGTIARTMMEDGRLDSISRIREIDKVLGTDLESMISAR